MTDAGRSPMDQRPLDPAVSVQAFEESAASHDDVLALWARERAVVGEEAQRRVHEALVAATIVDTGELVGVSTAVLRPVPQLNMDMWFLRAFVAEDRRTRNVAAHLLDRARSLLEERFVSGTDVRGAGVLIDVQNEGVRRAQPDAIWPSTLFIFIGETPQGGHVRVRYFPGAMVPPPPNMR